MKHDNKSWCVKQLECVKNQLLDIAAEMKELLWEAEGDPENKFLQWRISINRGVRKSLEREIPWLERAVNEVRNRMEGTSPPSDHERTEHDAPVCQGTAYQAGP